MQAQQVNNKSRRPLTMLSGETYLSDGGLETTLVFQRGIDLPNFAAFPLVRSADGRTVLKSITDPYMALATEAGVGFVLESPTWRASSDWGALMGFNEADIASVNAEAIALLAEWRSEWPDLQPILISGAIGPRGDGYAPDRMLTADEAAAYHSHQIDALAAAGADLITAHTMTHSGEAIGIAMAAHEAVIPSVISFTVETDGRLPSGEALGDAIRKTDDATGAAPAYYMINCAHPDHFAHEIDPDAAWVARIVGIRANASRCSHAELDAAEELDDGDPQDLANHYRVLERLLPNLQVFGGCCGTDIRHITAIAGACLKAA